MYTRLPSPMPSARQMGKGRGYQLMYQGARVSMLTGIEACVIVKDALQCNVGGVRWGHVSPLLSLVVLNIPP